METHLMTMPCNCFVFETSITGITKGKVSENPGPVPPKVLGDSCTHTKHSCGFKKCQWSKNCNMTTRVETASNNQNWWRRHWYWKAGVHQYRGPLACHLLTLEWFCFIWIAMIALTISPLCDSVICAGNVQDLWVIWMYLVHPSELLCHFV